MPRIALTVDGRATQACADNTTLLVDLLRGPLALTGTYVGCDTSQCGACAVLLVAAVHQAAARSAA